MVKLKDEHLDKRPCTWIVKGVHGDEEVVLEIKETCDRWEMPPNVARFLGEMLIDKADAVGCRDMS